jgi:hypothetical protein
MAKQNLAAMSLVADQTSEDGYLRVLANALRAVRRRMQQVRSTRSASAINMATRGAELSPTLMRCVAFARRSLFNQQPTEFLQRVCYQLRLFGGWHGSEYQVG